MKVSLQYAAEHFADLVSAVHNGEAAEIACAGPGDAPPPPFKFSCAAGPCRKRTLGAEKPSAISQTRKSWRESIGIGSSRLTRQQVFARSERPLLDSHTLLWTLYDLTFLPRGLVSLLEDPGNNLFVSDASVWELSDKASKKRLPLAEIQSRSSCRLLKPWVRLYCLLSGPTF